MQLIKVGAAVLNQTPLAWESNKANIVASIEAARRERVSLLCLPELCITGYGCEDAFLSPAVQRTAWRMLEEIVPTTRGIVVSIGLPVLHHSALYNAAALVADGRILGFAAKRFLAGDGIHYEPRWFKPWPVGRRADLAVGDESYPLGDIHFDVGGVKIGFEICEDAWVANRPGAELALRGVDVILNPSASHFAFGKSEVRHRFVLEGSRAFGVSYVYANLLGNEAGRIVYDGGAHIASVGQLVALGPRFSFADWRLTTAVIDVDATRLSRVRSGSYVPEAVAGDRSLHPWRLRVLRAGAASSHREASRMGDRAVRQGGGVRPCGGARTVRLHAKEPLPRVRRLDQRRGGLGGRLVPSRDVRPSGRRRTWLRGFYGKARACSRRGDAAEHRLHRRQTADLRLSIDA